MKKRIIAASVLLMILVSFSFSGCSSREKTAPAPTEPPAMTEEPTEEEQASPFYDTVYPRCFALAAAGQFSGRYASDGKPDADCLRYAAGWYAAYICRVEDCDLIEKSEIDGFLLRSGGSPDMLDEAALENLGVKSYRSQDAGVLYDFARFREQIGGLLGIDYEFTAEESGQYEMSVIFREHLFNGGTLDTGYDFLFEKSGNDYLLIRMSGAEPLVETDEALTFDYSLLVEQNSLDTLLSLYPAIRIRSTDVAGDCWITMKNGFILQLFEYPDATYIGTYMDYRFIYDGNRPRVTEVSSAFRDPGLYQDEISGRFSGAKAMRLESMGEDTITFNMDFASGYSEQMTVDRGTLALLRERSTFEYQGFTLVNTQSFDYSRPLQEPEYLRSWDKELRRVTVIWESFDANGRSVRTEVLELPRDWEFMPYQVTSGEYTAYMNEGYTELYSYPGDGIDYTLYLTTAKG